MRKAKKMWHIVGTDGTEKIYERKIRSSQMTVNQAKAMLKALAAKASLDYDEIVGAYARKRSKIDNELLLVQKDSSKNLYSCGENPYFYMTIVDVD